MKIKKEEKDDVENVNKEVLKQIKLRFVKAKKILPNLGEKKNPLNGDNKVFMKVFHKR